MTPEQIEKEFKKLKKSICCKQLVAKSYTTTQRDALTNVTFGTIIYNTSTDKLNYYSADGPDWIALP